MNRKSSIRAILLRKECLLFFLLLLPMFTKAQYNKVYADITSNMLVDMGFENVVWSEDEKERVYVLENTPWRLQGVGLAHAIDRIQKTGLPEKGKSCRIVVLDLYGKSGQLEGGSRLLCGPFRLGCYLRSGR